ncbi:MAG: site-specific integrase [Proteobacteria bacterium]|nr:site-specific integrase [Pseudomonadota bacterium]
MARPTKFRGKWRIRWVDALGKRRSEIYEDHNDAKFKLKQHELEKEEVRRGLRSLCNPDKKFAALCKYWLKSRALQKRSYLHDVSIIRAHLRPFFGKMKISDISPVTVNEFVTTRSHLNKKTVHNHLTLLISMLNAARDDLGWLVKVPKIRKPKVPKVNPNYRYLRTEEEIIRFLLTAKNTDDMAYMLYVTAINTGMRAGELAGLHWSDVDFSKRLIKVQRSFDGPTKSGETRYVPILDSLLQPLKEWRLRHPGKLVFSNQRGKQLQPSQRIFQETLKRVLDQAGFERVKRNGKTRWYVTFHDLRHTFASFWVMNSGDIFKLQKILGHQSLEMTMRYAHLSPDAFAGDYGRFGGALNTGNDITLLKKKNG